jgi:hypothetical protein
MEEDFNIDTEDDEQTGDPTWDALKPSERKVLLDEVFQDDDWYDGAAYYVGGQSNPAFDEIATRIGADSKTIKKYYAAWLSARGLDAKAAFQIPGSTGPVSGPDLSEGQRNTPGQHLDDMMRAPVRLPDPPVPQGGDSTSNSVFAMMSFMGQQQALQLEAMKFQTYQQMEQRRLDQQRELEISRASQARDQQFMTQQMSFMRDMMKKSDNDGFFDTEMKGIFKEKMVDQLLGNNEGGALERVASKLLNSDVISGVASGVSALANKRSVPAGYDVPSYDPYAQQGPVQQMTEEEYLMRQQQMQQQQMQPPTQEVAPQPQPQEQELPGFFSEGVEEAPVEFVEPTSDQYAMEILNAFKQVPGKAEELQDPKRLQALQERIEIAVGVIMTEDAALLPQKKVELMVERILLIDSVRDIGLGLRQALDEVKEGHRDKEFIIGFIITELKKNPIFANIFSTHSYEELISKIKPFEATGGLHHDIAFLQRYEVATLCREVLQAMHIAA